MIILKHFNACTQPDLPSDKIRAAITRSGKITRSSQLNTASTFGKNSLFSHLSYLHISSPPLISSRRAEPGWGYQSAPSTRLPAHHDYLLVPFTPPCHHQSPHDPSPFAAPTRAVSHLRLLIEPSERSGGRRSGKSNRTIHEKIIQRIRQALNILYWAVCGSRVQQSRGVAWEVIEKSRYDLKWSAD